MAELEELAADVYAASHSHFRSILVEYGRAVESPSPELSTVFEALRAAWKRLRARAVAPPDSTEASIDEETVLVLAFSQAAAVRTLAKRNASTSS